MAKTTNQAQLLSLSRNIPRAALSLDKDSIFKLLMFTTALLGWVVALATAGSLMMQQVYHSWRLEQAETLSIYVPADADAAALTSLEAALQALPNIKSVSILAPEQVRAMVEPYVANPATLALPVVLEVRVKPTAANALTSVQQQVAAVVQPLFATAEVDDARPVLNAVAGAVRVMQSLGLGLAAVMAVLMALLVTLTVRVGLRAQRPTLNLLQHLGATDGRLLAEVVNQVLERALVGWLLAVSAAAAMLGASVWLRPELASVAPVPVWLGLVVVPLVLPLVAVVVAALVARRVLVKL